MFKKSQFVEYMVDVKGYEAVEAGELWNDIGGTPAECLSMTEVEELIAYWS